LAERIPRGKPPNLARRGEIATKIHRNSDQHFLELTFL
jgi:hypothetical protein